MQKFLEFTNKGIRIYDSASFLLAYDCVKNHGIETGLEYSEKYFADYQWDLMEQLEKIIQHEIDNVVSIFCGNNKYFTVGEWAIAEKQLYVNILKATKEIYLGWIKQDYERKIRAMEMALESKKIENI
jgi:hypothetical protein